MLDIITQACATDIARPQSAHEAQFWEKVCLAALHRVDAFEAAREASSALLQWREMDVAAQPPSVPIDFFGKGHPR
jgi:hypothetical protein